MKGKKIYGIFFKIKKNKDDVNKDQLDDDLIFQETVKEVLGIELKHLNRRDSSSTAYRNGLMALAVRVRLEEPATMKKFEEVYKRKKWKN